MLRLALLRPYLLRAARNLGGAAVSRIGPVVRRAAGLVSGIAIAYPAPRGAHRLVGSRVPDLPLVGPGRLFESLRRNRFVLVTGADTPSPCGAVDVVRPAGVVSTELLVRPDGHVAWASDQPDPAGRAVALATWLGSREDS